MHLLEGAPRHDRELHGFLQVGGHPLLEELANSEVGFARGVDAILNDVPLLDTVKQHIVQVLGRWGSLHFLLLFLFLRRIAFLLRASIVLLVRLIVRLVRLDRVLVPPQTFCHLGQKQSFLVLANSLSLGGLAGLEQGVPGGHGEEQCDPRQCRCRLPTWWPNQRTAQAEGVEVLPCLQCEGEDRDDSNARRSECNIVHHGSCEQSAEGGADAYCLNSLERLLESKWLRDK
mmetsp:Transcript_55620/g.180537  ORF Transcript_55620/g.180537 Transcript_55620/m.180537 type:complete len:231 (+) Transcript_55620:591-1283(+)